ncbi:hypothetical protein SAMN04488025_10150 [Planifilum fulgidum]|uniref:PEGA domain-containing protein n=1 Tax=Planifilum fulgidum TaxID=201973 RepID=A0A1I2KA76_9BACL|nr:hypothetical protein [Planifilum fulgidum]SFF63209.1 hypothetical protein SAMN04488025_10150 [Planifilum fulgidum]
MNPQIDKDQWTESLQVAKGWALRRKGIVALVVIAVFVLVGISFAATDDPEEVVRKFEEAVYNNDVDALEEIVSPDDDRMEIDRRHLADFLERIQKNERTMEMYLSLLRYQLASFEGNYAPYPDKYNLEQMDYYLKWEDGFLFDSYSIGVRPYYMRIKASEKGGTVKVDGEEVLTPEEGNIKVVGPLMPGRYKVEGSKKYPYALVKDTREVALFDDTDGEVEVEVDLTGTHVELYSAFGDTRVIVNGKPTDKTVKELKKFGPVSQDGSVTLQGERKFPWGVSRSDKKKVEQYTASVDLTPKPFADKKGQEQIISTINAHFKQWGQAVAKGDPSVYTVGDDGMKKELIEAIEEIRQGYKEESLGTRIDLDNIKFTYENDHYVLSIPVEYHYRHNDNFDERMQEEIVSRMVTLRYDEKGKRWWVHSSTHLYTWQAEDYFKGKGVVKSEFK